MKSDLKRPVVAIILALTCGIALGGCNSAEVRDGVQAAKPIIKWIIPAAGAPAIPVCIKYCPQP